MDLKRILSVPGQYSALGQRNRAMIILAMTSGLGFMEMCRLKLNDLDLKKGRILKETRICPGSECIAILREYLEKSRPVLVERRKNRGLPSHDHVILSRSGKPVTKHIYLEALRRTCGKAGVLRMSYPQLCRLWKENPESARRIMQVTVESAEGLRDHAILALRVQGGLQPRQILRLCQHNLELDRGSIRFGHNLELNPLCHQWLCRYVEEIRPRLVCGYRHGMVFVSRHGMALTHSMILRIFREIRGHAGVEGVTYSALGLTWRSLAYEEQRQILEHQLFHCLNILQPSKLE